MKVAFVYPAFENLGIEYISAMLKKAGHDTLLAFDPQMFNDLYLSWPTMERLFDYRDRVIARLRRERPDVVAFSVVSDLFPWACAMAERVKRELGDVPVVFGGQHVTAVPHRVLAKPCVDYVVQGEGEYPMLELVERLRAGRPVDDIANLGFRKNGDIVVNEPRPLIQDLDELPFPDTDLFLAQNPYARREYNVITARGCVGACAYCHNSMDRRLLWKGRGKFLRRRSMDSVLTELRQRKEKYGFTTLCLWDEVFTCDADWLEEFCARYKREVNVPFWCFLHPNHISERVVRILEDAGCWEVEMGVQTLNPFVKKELLNRPESQETIERAIDIFRSSKVRIVVDVIFGLPILKEDDYRTLVRAFNAHVPNKVQTFWLRYYPSTDIIEPAMRLGLVTPQDHEDILNGVPHRAAASGGTRIDPQFVRYQTLLSLLPFLPRRLVSYLIERNAIRLLPNVAGFGHLFTRLFDLGNKNDAGARRYKGRMFYFFRHKVFPAATAARASGRSL